MGGESMKRYLFTILSVLGFPVSAMASPTYLKCTIEREPSPVDIEVTADEDNSRVVLYLPHSGLTERLPAIFDGREVRFQDRAARYTISRVDLSVSRYIPIFRVTENGQCRIDAKPKRAF